MVGWTLHKVLCVLIDGEVVRGDRGNEGNNASLAMKIRGPGHAWYKLVASLAQLAELALRKRMVMGSIPIGG